jgi:hypothetical protein
MDAGKRRGPGSHGVLWLSLKSMYCTMRVALLACPRPHLNHDTTILLNPDWNDSVASVAPFMVAHSNANCTEETTADPKADIQQCKLVHNALSMPALIFP